MLNSFSVTCVNSSQPPLTQADSNSLKPDRACPESIPCTEEQMFGLLCALVQEAWPRWDISVNVEVHCQSIAQSVTKLLG